MPFDVNEDGLQFVSAVLGFLRLNKEQLDSIPPSSPTRASRYIEIERDSCTERLIIDEVSNEAGTCIAGRVTTCWKAHLEGDE